jgi:hypothetical protein
MRNSPYKNLGIGALTFPEINATVGREAFALVEFRSLSVSHNRDDQERGRKGISNIAHSPTAPSEIREIALRALKDLESSHLAKAPHTTA